MAKRKKAKGERFELKTCCNKQGLHNGHEPLGSGCGTAVENAPCDPEVVSLNPAGCWTLTIFPSSE